MAGKDTTSGAVQDHCQPLLRRQPPSDPRAIVGISIVSSRTSREQAEPQLHQLRRKGRMLEIRGKISRVARRRRSAAGMAPTAGGQVGPWWMHYFTRLGPERLCLPAAGRYFRAPFVRGGRRLGVVTGSHASRRRSGDIRSGRIAGGCDRRRERYLHQTRRRRISPRRSRVAWPIPLCARKSRKEPTSGTERVFQPTPTWPTYGGCIPASDFPRTSREADRPMLCL